MKHIKLFENFDSVNESEFIAGDYKMTATKDGEIQVVDSTTNKTYVYLVSAGMVGIKVKDFPEGNSILVSALGKSIQSPLPKDGSTVKAIKDNIGKSKIKFDLPAASLTLTCKSGCDKGADNVANIKVSAEEFDIDLEDILDSAKDAGHNVIKAVEGGAEKLKSILKW